MTKQSHGRKTKSTRLDGLLSSAPIRKTKRRAKAESAAGDRNQNPRLSDLLNSLSSSSRHLIVFPPGQVAAMAIHQIHEQPSDPHQIDRLSNLPDALLVTILSLLPIRMAARTSVLCRRFRRLCEVAWETSPSLELISSDFPRRRTSAARFFTMAERTLLRRSPTHPLLSLRLELGAYYFSQRSSEVESFAFSLFAKARSLGVRHLNLDLLFFSPACLTLPLIFSINSLESLSLYMIIIHDRPEDAVLPSAATLTNLKSLSIERRVGDPAKLNLFLSQLCSLEDLCFTHCAVHALSLSSQTIRKLKLILILIVKTTIL